jgi:hypothetical protein
VLLVSPWHGFTPALNAIVGEAVRLEADKLVFMSREVQQESVSFAFFKPWIAPDVLVVGARLSESHGAGRGEKSIDAYKSPWNTLAVWNAHLLGMTGFQTISDGHRQDVPAGMEEVITISLLQHLYGGRARAYLVDVHGIRWRDLSGDPIRDEAHRSKMGSKHERAEAQLLRMGISRGSVIVVPHSHAVAAVVPSVAPSAAPGPNEE